MGEIVGFPAAGPRTPDPAAERRSDRNEKAKNLREFLEQGRLMKPAYKMRLADKLLVAERVWLLLEGEKERVSKTEILRAARISNHDTDSTKHLGYYAVNPDWPHARKDKVKHALRGRPEGYLRIIDAFVEKTGKDSDDTLLYVFGGTNIDSNVSAGMAKPEFEDLARMLCEICYAVASKHRLQEFFQAVAREDLCLEVTNAWEEEGRNTWDSLKPDEIELEFCQNRGNLYWPIAFREAVEEADGLVAPYPSVVLGEWEVGEQFPIQVKCDDHPREGEYGPFEGETNGWYKVELLLCIVPYGTEMRPEPALRVNTKVFVNALRGHTSAPNKWTDDGLSNTLIFSDITYMQPFPDSDDELVNEETDISTEAFVSFIGTLFDGWPAIVATSNRELRVELSCDRSKIPFPVNRYCPFSRGFRKARPSQFLPINGSVLEDWLSLSPEHSTLHWARDKPLHQRVLGPPLIDLVTDVKAFSAFKTDRIAAQLDNCLMGPTAQSPLTILDSRSEQFVRLFAAASEERRSERAADDARLKARIRSMHRKGVEPDGP